MRPTVKKTNESVLVRARVTPSARRESIVEREGVFHIAVKEKAEGNQANLRVRELIALHHSVPTKAVRIVSGHTSSSKKLSITH